MEVLIEKANAPNKQCLKDRRIIGKNTSFIPIDKDVGSDPNSLLRLLGFGPATEEEILEIERLFTSKDGRNVATR